MLAADEPHPVRVRDRTGRSPFLLVCDHAGNAIPRKLGTLGLREPDLARHIAWDIGAGALAEKMSTRMGATLIRQHYSRLVIDCNRSPSSPEAIWRESDGTVVPGNLGLTAEAAARRVDAILSPYQAAIDAAIAERLAAGRETILISLHSFTPAMGGVARPWQIGILHGGGDARFALALLEELQALAGVEVGDNLPYRMDETDYTVPLHAHRRGLPYAEIELRQDLLSDAKGIEAWSARIADALAAARAGPPA